MFGDMQLTDKDFNKYREIVYKEAGIKLNDSKKALLQARLTRRLRTLKIDEFSEYLDYLMENYEEEKVNFINCITTNKTEFFRESKHFDFMTEKALPEFVNMGIKEIKIWSAGCSTGEEPYTTAITLQEYFENKTKPEIKILATDIDTQVLDKAKEGIYASDIIEDIPVDILKKYFYKGKAGNEGLFKVKDNLKNMITFLRLNLLDEAYPMKGQFDIIFCRNVIIYFDRETQKKLFNKFSRYLAGHGYLFLGHSENISAISDDFTLIGNTIYKKTSE
jgi:chemotaxis protein methyltransferase CheR